MKSHAKISWSNITPGISLSMQEIDQWYLTLKVVISIASFVQLPSSNVVVAWSAPSVVCPSIEETCCLHHQAHSSIIGTKVALPCLQSLIASSLDRIAIHCDVKKVPPLDECVIQDYLSEPYLIDGLKFGKSFSFQSFFTMNECRCSHLCSDHFLWSTSGVHLQQRSRSLRSTDLWTAQRRELRKFRFPASRSIDGWFLVESTNPFDQPYFERRYLRCWSSKETLSSFSLRVFEKTKAEHWCSLATDSSKSSSPHPSCVHSRSTFLKDMVTKTIFLVEPHLLTAYEKCRPGSVESSESVCFELLAFDLLLDKNLRPWLIDVSNGMTALVSRYKIEIGQSLSESRVQRTDRIRCEDFTVDRHDRSTRFPKEHSKKEYRRRKGWSTASIVFNSRQTRSPASSHSVRTNGKNIVLLFLFNLFSK